jgi:hypothetical protein
MLGERCAYLWPRVCALSGGRAARTQWHLPPHAPRPLTALLVTQLAMKSVMELRQEQALQARAAGGDTRSCRCAALRLTEGHRAARAA